MSYLIKDPRDEMNTLRTEYCTLKNGYVKKNPLDLEVKTYRHFN